MADTIDKSTKTATPAPWEAQWPDNEAEYPDRGAAFIVGAPFEGLVGAALPLPTELDNGDFSRVWENAKLIVTAVNERSALLKCETALREARGALAREGWTDKGLEFIDSALSLLDEARNGK